jgi:purine-cytosine permease-like protein
LSALDLVIAMPVSWLPLVADFARHGRDGNSALRGTWLGYAIANIWCYALGCSGGHHRAQHRPGRRIAAGARRPDRAWD